MNLPRYSQLRFSVMLGIGALVALALCVQCVRTFLYADSVLIPRQAEHEAERQGGALTAAARIEQLTEGGPVLGLLPNARCSVGTLQIAESDSLILYSDGLNEAVDQKDEQFGEGRIGEIVAGCTNAPAAGICRRIIHHVTAFASAGAPADDRTLMVVRFLSPGAGGPAIMDTVQEAAA